MREQWPPSRASIRGRSVGMAINCANRLISSLCIATPICCASNTKISLVLSTFSKLNLCSLCYHTPRRIRNPTESSNSREETLLSLSRQCSTIKDLEQLHAQIVQLGFDQNLYVVGKILEFCAVLGRDLMSYSEKIFEHIERPDGFLWNTMIRGFGSASHHQKALEYYERMREKGEKPDNFTFSFLLKVCGKLGSVMMGKQIHCSSIIHGLDTYMFVRNTLIHMYGMLRDIKAARQLFDEMPCWDLVAWNSMIHCYFHCGRYEEVLHFYTHMLQNGIQPDEATLVVTISACSALGALDFGSWVHFCIDKIELNEIVSVSNSLIDMYAKCGAIEQACKTFNEMKQRNIVSWNTIIAGLAMHGYGVEALNLFAKMVDEKLEKPDGITFLGVLCACSHEGLVEEGRSLFDSMNKEYNIEPNIKHYGCMVDLLGRAALLQEAYQLIQGIQTKCSAILWRTLLASCRVHGNLELGVKVQKHLLELEYHSSDYSLLANMYASAEQWNEVVKVRISVRDDGALKPVPANSCVNIQAKRITEGEFNEWLKFEK
ncbi:hypothetical protein Nepgr_023248 [Nepenthes gracilis]|uniref:Pentatricopeptide repeat-containing protein n=1 Tax=Nepenthes gracilis TaxID=150966 RepID=A0AAD3XZ74_NEPGR|nr:hypothetical protein Nepgr_023248 [Nepenthes gracilis]